MTRVLVVEDNARNLKLVRDVLQGNGFETLEARNAEDGIALATALAPDIVLMDIQLPGVNGVDALKALRANPATAAIPVIAVTACVTTRDVERITAAGFDAFIAKPIRYASFLGAVRAVLAKAAT